MNDIKYIAAIDLGASTGRVILGRYQTDTKNLTLTEIYRFANRLVNEGGHHYWDVVYLEEQILIGLNTIVEQGILLDSIGIDTWGVDYVLLNKDGNVIAPTYSYRDHRTSGVMEQVQKALGIENIYQKTGIQYLTFNTLYQLKAMVDSDPVWLNDVTDFVMIPDYFSYRLTGKLNREYTNATTTQLVNVGTRDWDSELLAYLGVPRSWFGDIKKPGNTIGYWANRNGDNIPVIAIASHDTASAVIASPQQEQNSAYLCSGTWSLMGIDAAEAYTSAQAFQFNITNEGGVAGHYRVLKNIMGLWLFQRICHEHDIKDIAELVSLAKLEQPFAYLINPNHQSFLNPSSMTEAIKTYCQHTQQIVPQTVAQLARCIFDSLAMLYKQVMGELTQLTGQDITTLHVVGGGCQNQFLNQLCADLCHVEVTSGPIEASILGNIGYQLISQHSISSVNELRQIITDNFPLQHYSPELEQIHYQQLIADKWRQFCSLA